MKNWIFATIATILLIAAVTVFCVGQAFGLMASDDICVSVDVVGANPSDDFIVESWTFHGFPPGTYEPREEATARGSRFILESSASASNFLRSGESTGYQHNQRIHFTLDMTVLSIFLILIGFLAIWHQWSKDESQHRQNS